jgi:methyl-accepting chemotaxis protein
VLSKFEAMDLTIRTVTEQEENIRNAMEEQGEGSKQVLQGVGKMNSVTSQVRDGAYEMIKGTDEVISESKNLEKVSQDVTTKINDMASSAGAINNAINLVNGISDKNRETIAALIKDISRFKDTP